MTGTESERQEEKKGKQRRTTGMQMPSGGRNTTNDKCEGNLA
jgi:hypothetical protein